MTKEKPLILQTRGGMKIYIYKDGTTEKESPITGKMYRAKFKNKARAIKFARKEGYIQKVKKK